MTLVRTAHGTVAAAMTGSAGGVFAITGPAGSGKSTTARAVAGMTGCAYYSADFRFIGDSAERRRLLERKQARSSQDYRDSANQYNWWDWAAIDRDLTDLARGMTVRLEGPYDRETGGRGASVEIRPHPHILFEGALLGPPGLVGRLETVFFLCTPARTRLERVLEKDGNRRSFNDVLARFLITEYSETIYYRNLFEWAGDRLTFVDAATGRPCAPPTLAEDLFVPLKVTG